MMDIQDKNEIIIQIIEETLNTGFSNIKTINEFGYYRYYMKAEEIQGEDGKCKIILK